MVTATALGLVGPIALLGAVVLNVVLLWRAAPGLRKALLGTGPSLVAVQIRPDGEPNVVLFQPRLKPLAACPCQVQMARPRLAA